MADWDDFTFCQVEKPVDGVEDRHVAAGIGGICIDDKNANGNLDSGNIWKVGVSSQKTVGTLTFNVIDASTQKVMNERPKLDAKEVAGSSSKASLEQKTLVEKPMPRKKVPYEIGYSPLDWVKLTRTHPDLAALNGQSNRRLITMAEVKQHKSEGSMWTALKGRVYNIEPYMKFHPGDKTVNNVDEVLRSMTEALKSHEDQEEEAKVAEKKVEEVLVGSVQEVVEEVLQERVEKAVADRESVQEPPVQPELISSSVVVPEDLFVSKSSLQIISGRPTQEVPIIIPPFSAPEDVTFDAGQSSGAVAAGQGKDITMRTDFHSPEPDEPTPSSVQLDNLLSNISALSYAVSQLKHHTTSMNVDKINVDKIKSTLQENLKRITTDVSSLIFGLDKLSKKATSNLLKTHDALSNRIDFVHSSLSKKIDSVQNQLTKVSSQMSSALILLTDLSLLGVDKKGETEKTDGGKKRAEPNSKRTDNEPIEKKSRS